MTQRAALKFSKEPMTLAARALEDSFENTDDHLAHSLRLALYGPGTRFLQLPSKQFRARLVELTWKLVGATGDVPPELPAAVELIHAGSLIVDDIQDDSAIRRGAPTVHKQHGIPLALNLGNHLYFVGLQLLGQFGDEPAAQMFRCATQAMSQCHRGQALDLATPVDEIPTAMIAERVLAVTELKTATLMRLSASLACIAARADQETVQATEEFAFAVGVGLQMLDDVGGLASSSRFEKAMEDLRHSRPTWPWAWVAKTDPDLCLQLQSCSRTAESPDQWKQLKRRLCEATEALGRNQSRWKLERAFEALRERQGDSAALRDMAEELHRLQRSYG